MITKAAGVRLAKSENVKSRKSRTEKLASEPRLNRTTFSTSREMDFFSERELVTQTGHPKEEWPFVFLKEAIDNGLDACDEHSIAPTIVVSADATGITVKDTGLGLPESTLNSQLDFSVRASSREAYVAPDRGAQGNALKTLLAMPTVVDPISGKLILSAGGHRHEISCGADPISQKPVVRHDVTALRTMGTSIRMEWSAITSHGKIIWPFDHVAPLGGAENSWSESFAERFRGMIEGFALFNPHANFHLEWFGKTSKWNATDRGWEKWRPNKPTSALWYEPSHLERLIGAYIAHDMAAGKDRLVSDVLEEFDGMAGSKKRSNVLNATNLHRAKLSTFVQDGKLDGARVASFLAAIQQESRPIKSQYLGVIGKEHMKKSFMALGVKEESFRYERSVAKEGIAWVLEVAFGAREEHETELDLRKTFVGANWSAAVNNPLHSFGDGSGLDALLEKAKAGDLEPVVYALHLAHPRTEYTDRGKSSLVVKGGAV